jgi:hypothetical protein
MERDRPPLAKYANWFNIGHNHFEFVFDIGQFHTEGRDSLVHTRIVTGPAYAKVLWELLSESIRRYEDSFGQIPNLGPEEQESD